MKLCKDCRWFDIAETEYEGEVRINSMWETCSCCLHPKVSRINPVSGNHMQVFCDLARAPNAVNQSCGPEGKLWEPAADKIT